MICSKCKKTKTKGHLAIVEGAQFCVKCLPKRKIVTIMRTIKAIECTDRLGHEKHVGLLVDIPAGFTPVVAVGQNG